jgi:hypothetical protein
MGIFHQVNSLVASENHGLILSSKILLYLKLAKHAQKTFLKIGFQICAHFCSCFSGCWAIRSFVIFRKTKVAKTH